MIIDSPAQVLRRNRDAIVVVAGHQKNKHHCKKYFYNGCKPKQKLIKDAWNALFEEH